MRGDVVFNCADGIKTVEFPFFDAFKTRFFSDTGADQVSRSLGKPLQRFFCEVITRPLIDGLVEQLAADRRCPVLTCFKSRAGEVQNDRSELGTAVPHTAEDLVRFFRHIFGFPEFTLTHADITVVVGTDIYADFLCQAAAHFFLEKTLKKFGGCSDFLRSGGINPGFLENFNTGPDRGNGHCEKKQQKNGGNKR